MPKKSSSSSNSRPCLSNSRTSSSAVGSGRSTSFGATTSPKRSISSSSNEFPVEITLSDDNDLFGMSSSQLLLSLLLLALPKLTVVLRNALADGAKVRPPVDDLKPAARFDTHWLTIAGTRFPYNTQRYKNKLIQD